MTQSRVSPRHAAVAAILLALAVPAMAQQPAASADGYPRGPAGAPVPEAWDYVRLTPQQRFDLRASARALPTEQRTQHNKALKTEIDKLPDWIHEALHDERTAMDCRNETVAPLPKPPKLDAWAYAKRVPTDRYEFRLRARALDPQARAEYDAHLAAELARLPAWLQTALADEAVRLDAYYGVKQCPDVSPVKWVPRD